MHKYVNVPGYATIFRIFKNLLKRPNSNHGLLIDDSI